MPISLSAKKSLRKAVKNSKVNVLFKNKLKLTVKKFLAKPTSDSLKEAYSMVDMAAKKGIFHKNKSSRLKAKFAKQLKSGESTKSVVKAKKTVKKGSKLKAKSKSLKKK
jgi:small subunit ribosomal protein S20